MSTLKNLRAELHERSDASKWILRYFVFWGLLTPFLLWIWAATQRGGTLDTWRAFTAYGIAHAAWVIYFLARVLGWVMSQKDTLLDTIISGKAMVPPPPPEAAAPVEMMMNTAPDPGTDSTSKKVKVTPAWMEKYLEHNGHLLSLAEIDGFIEKCKGKSWDDVKFQLLNLRKPFVRESPPSPTVTFSMK